MRRYKTITSTMADSSRWRRCLFADKRPDNRSDALSNGIACRRRCAEHFDCDTVRTRLMTLVIILRRSTGKFSFDGDRETGMCMCRRWRRAAIRTHCCRKPNYTHGWVGGWAGCTCLPLPACHHCLLSPACLPALHCLLHCCACLPATAPAC